MKVFVTGDHSPLCERLLRKLIQEKHDVTLLLEPRSSWDGIAGIRQVLRRPLYDVAADSQILKDQDVVLHGIQWPRFDGTWNELHSRITLDTADFARVCAKAGVRRFVYLSTEKVIQDIEELQKVTERHPYPRRINSAFGRAHMLAEKEILGLKVPMEILTLRPAHLWGAENSIRAFRLEAPQTKKMVWVNEGRCLMETVHVDNLVEALNQSLIYGQNRGIYFVTDGRAQTLREHVGGIINALWVDVPRISVSSRNAKALATMGEAVWNFLRLPHRPPLTLAEWYFAAVTRTYNIARTRSELLYSPVISIELALHQISTHAFEESQIAKAAS